jgi:hypothetical protein
MEYRSNQVYAALASMGVLNRQGEARRLLSEYRQLRATQVMLARELGLTPAARIALKATGTHTPFDLPPELVATVNEVGESRALALAAAASALILSQMIREIK